jgi:PAS domain S-box-containing protein
MSTIVKQPPYFWTQLITSDGAFGVDRNQRIVWWSPSAQRILGFRSEEVMGKPCYEVIAGRDSGKYGFCRRNCPVMVNARRGRPTPDYDISCVLPSGEEKWLNVSVIVPSKGRGNLQALHLFRDVSRRRRTEEFVKKASAALRALLKEETNHLSTGVDESPTPLPRLSRRELEVLRLLAAGMSTRQMANAMAIQPVTARNHVARVLTKLGVGSRLQAVVYASEHRII